MFFLLNTKMLQLNRKKIMGVFAMAFTLQLSEPLIVTKVRLLTHMRLSSMIILTA